MGFLQDAVVKGDGGSKGVDPGFRLGVHDTGCAADSEA